MEQTINRRGFLRRVVAVGGGAALSFGGFSALAAEDPSAKSASERMLTWYALDPSAEVMDGSSCRTCNACVAHAENKLFATPNAAHRNRAHVGCRCGIVAGGELPESVWRALFGDPETPKRASADRRFANVARVLS